MLFVLSSCDKKTNKGATTTVKILAAKGLLYGVSCDEDLF